MSNDLYWWVYSAGVFNWITGLLIHNYILYSVGMTLMIGNFLGWFGERFKEEGFGITRNKQIRNNK